jgi:5'-nucleotidase
LKKPLILVTNDDGITAPGLRALIEVMTTLGEVVVVAPDKPQSAMGHAITINNVLHITRVSAPCSNVIEYSCSGTPADCVKMATSEILDRRPDLCVSGINHGSNASINVIYSGTMSAAVEAAIEGIPAIGFSLCNFSWEANFEPTLSYVKKLASAVLQHKLPDGVLLNVNFPNHEKTQIKGLKICRQAKAQWIEKFDKRRSPMGKDYYWLTGDFINQDQGQDTDIYALENGFVSVVPVQFDLTAHHALQVLDNWNLNE